MDWNVSARLEIKSTYTLIDDRVRKPSSAAAATDAEEIIKRYHRPRGMLGRLIASLYTLQGARRGRRLARGDGVVWLEVRHVHRGTPAGCCVTNNHQVDIGESVIR